MINQMLLDLLASITLTASRSRPIERVQIFEKIFGFEGIKRTFVRSLASKEPVHILLVGPPGQAKTMFLKCILEKFGKKAFFTVGGNASKSGAI
jgi:Holliday junction DNA helicase RuvB